MAASRWRCLKAWDTELNRRKCQGTAAGPGQNGCDLLRTNGAPGTACPAPPLASSRQSVGDAHGLASIIGSLLTSQRHNLFLGSASCCHGNAHSSHGTCGSDTLWSIGRGACDSQSHRRPVRPRLSDSSCVTGSVESWPTWAERTTWCGAFDRVWQAQMYMH